MSTIDHDYPVVIIGLGNPGKTYSLTRHNVGFMAVDSYAQVAGINWSLQTKYNAEIGEIRLRQDKLITLKPTTYMNNSGTAVQKIVQFYKVPLNNLIVLHDDLDLEFGVCRTKLGGGDGGHNGLKSISSSIGNDYFRIRIGIGRPKGPMSAADYVLHKFSVKELKFINEDLMIKTNSMIDSLLEQGLLFTQNQFH